MNNGAKIPIGNLRGYARIYKDGLVDIEGDFLNLTTKDLREVVDDLIRFEKMVEGGGW